MFVAEPVPPEQPPPELGEDGLPVEKAVYTKAGYYFNLFSALFNRETTLRGFNFLLNT